MPLVFEFLLLGLFGLALFGIFRFLASRLPSNRHYRFGLAVTMISAFLLFWVNGAVGIIGSENNDVNMLYFVVLVVAFFSAVAIRFRPAHMTWIMSLSAAALIMIALVALVGGLGVSGPVWPWDVVWITVFFSGLCLFAAWLFKQAAIRENESSDDTLEASA